MFDKKFLKESPVFWSRLGGEWYPPLLDPEGKPYYGNTEEENRTYQRYHRDFAAAGVHVHSMVLDRGWVREGEMDFRVTDLQLKQLFGCLLIIQPSYRLQMLSTSLQLQQL